MLGCLLALGLHSLSWSLFSKLTCLTGSLPAFHVEVRWFGPQRQDDSKGSHSPQISQQELGCSSCHLKPSYDQWKEGFPPSPAVAASLGWVLLGLYLPFATFSPDIHSIWEIFYYLLRRGLAIYCRLASGMLGW